MRHNNWNGTVATLAFYTLLIMESHGADSGIYQRIPVWDGRAATWRHFQKTHAVVFGGRGFDESELQPIGEDRTEAERRREEAHPII